MLLTPKTYFYNTVEFPRFAAEKDKPQIGFIAQEVEVIQIKQKKKKQKQQKKKKKKQK